ncbi:hypothetical protein [Hymenobacter sp. BT730]|uniref:hypothetical protein n=1 Tax=Hymenobacter sp. BT730 TaxID=3063332 RepID=UPI0026DEE53D|nr:hypothetical protein [Hymenobacter sp. BT730]
MAGSPTQELVSTSDTCNALRISARTLGRWAQNNWLQRIRQGRRIYYLRSEAETLGKAIYFNTYVDLYLSPSSASA